MKYTVDRIEGDIAVLENEDERRVKVNVSLLPEGVREGSCLAKENGAFRLDEASAEALRRKHYMLQQRMKKKKTPKSNQLKKMKKN